MFLGEHISPVDRTKRTLNPKRTLYPESHDFGPFRPVWSDSKGGILILDPGVDGVTSGWRKVCDLSFVITKIYPTSPKVTKNGETDMDTRETKDLRKGPKG